MVFIWNKLAYLLVVKISTYWTFVGLLCDVYFKNEIEGQCQMYNEKKKVKSNEPNYLQCGGKRVCERVISSEQLGIAAITLYLGVDLQTSRFRAKMYARVRDRYRRIVCPRKERGERKIIRRSSRRYDGVG